MKRIAWLGGLIFFVIIGFALYSAMDTGVKSPILAEGTIELTPELAGSAQGITTLFIIINDADSPRPMPYGAVKEHLSADFTQPFTFTLTREKMTMMNPDAPLPQNMRLKARLDRDGVAGVDQPGDLVGIVDGVKFGGSGVTLRIDRRIE